MLQKIFRRGRNSLTKSSAKEDNTSLSSNSKTNTSRLSFKKPKLFHSKSLDESHLCGGKRSSTTATASEDDDPSLASIRKAPLAGKDDSFDGGGGGGGDNNSRKVHFVSPHGTLDNLTGGGAPDEKLFDDSMMKAFEVGNLSIQEFLESPHTSPDTTPDTTLIKKSRETTIVHNDLTRSKSLPASPVKKPSLLDQAHAKASGSNTARLPASPALRRQIEMRSNVRSIDSANTPVTNSNGKPILKKSHRFSKSLEHLAQQVFGKEFEKQLEKATDPLIKVPLVVEHDSCKQEGKDDGEQELSNSHPDDTVVLDSESKDRENNMTPLKCPKSEPVNRKLIDAMPKKLTPGAPFRRTIQRCQSAVQQSELRVSSKENNMMTVQQNHEMAKSVDFPPSPDENDHDKLESWVNKLDLSGSQASSINAESAVSLCTVGASRMDPVIEGVPLQSPRKPVVVTTIEKNSLCGIDVRQSSNNTTTTKKIMLKDRQRANSEGCVISTPLTTNLLQQRFRDTKKLIKSDSTAATYGSDGDLNASVNSILDLNFPPPPPTEDGESDSLFLEGDFSPRLENGIQENTLSFDWEVVSSDGEGGGGGSPSYIEAPPPHPDPLTDSLFSVVPLPEDPAQLRPALTRALSEVISEIISSRQKLNRILRAIEMHQQILKDQSRQIQTQSRQIAELRFTQLELTNTLMTQLQGASEAVVKRRQSNNMDSYHSTRGNTNADNPNNIVSRRRPQSARTYRQSREMIDLSKTLDFLLNQCSKMQLSPRYTEASSTLRSKNTPKFGASTLPKSFTMRTSRKQTNSTSVKRSNTFPSREHVPTLKRIESDGNGHE